MARKNIYMVNVEQRVLMTKYVWASNNDEAVAVAENVDHDDIIFDDIDQFGGPVYAQTDPVKLNRKEIQDLKRNYNLPI